MRWQEVLGVALGFIVIGPLVTVLIVRTSAGGFELLLGAILGSVIGYFVAGRMAARPGPDRTGA